MCSKEQKSVTMYVLHRAEPPSEYIGGACSMRMQKFNVSAAAVRIIRGLRLSLSRPLFLVLAGITAAIWAAELVFPCRLVDYEAIREEKIELTGTVSALEQKREGEDLVWKMVLKDVVIRNILSQDFLFMISCSSGDIDSNVL